MTAPWRLKTLVIVLKMRSLMTMSLPSLSLVPRQNLLQLKDGGVDCDCAVALQNLGNRAEDALSDDHVLAIPLLGAQTDGILFSSKTGVSIVAALWRLKTSVMVLKMRSLMTISFPVPVSGALGDFQLNLVFLPHGVSDLCGVVAVISASSRDAWCVRRSRWYTEGANESE